MNLILFKAEIASVSPTDFIEYWSRFYDYPEEHLYSESIQKDQFDLESIEKLFVWKNNMVLSKRKQASFSRIVSKIGLINELKMNWLENKFNESFGSINAIWQIFLMHIIQPTRFPIFDQHVYRAHCYLLDGLASEIPGNNKKKISYYKTKYVPFYDDFRKKSTGHSSKEIDNALWAFGRFIKNNPHLFESRFLQI
jgi:hypothetical protein